MKIYEAFAAALLEHGADPLFGLMGDANMLYVGDFSERGGRFIPTAHECSAVGMANAWSQATGQVGFATVTCGPGMANTFTTLVEAVKSQSSVLVLTGSAPTEPTHFQHLNISLVAAAAGAGYEEVLSERWAVRDLNRAIQRVVAERRPVVLNLPQDMLLSDAGGQQAVVPPAPRSAAQPAESQLDGALGLIASASRPIVFAGKGALLADAHDMLVALAGRLGAPLTTSVLTKDLFLGHPANLGICGSVSHPVASAALAEADCIIVFGASLNAYTTLQRELAGGTRIVQVDDSPGAFGRYLPVDAAVTGDARIVAETMVKALESIDHKANRGWLDRIQVRLAERDPRDDFRDQSGEDTVDIRTASIVLDEVLPKDRNMVSDIGRFVHAAWPYISTSDPVGFTTMGAFGSVGLGLAGAIGMAVARPDQPTVCVIGDGGFMMNPAELVTAVREGLPLVLVVYDDGAYGFEWHKMLGFGADPQHSLLTWPDLADLAESMGAKAHTARTVEQLMEVGPLAKDLAQPLVVVVKLDPAIDIVP